MSQAVRPFAALDSRRELRQGSSPSLAPVAPDPGVGFRGPIVTHAVADGGTSAADRGRPMFECASVLREARQSENECDADGEGAA
jgi:hypothetical protein